jgi:2-polyprenyl-3-methyl-5-hydroxy-6-metoxy-1,4-benzoquinol methylase
VRALDCFRWAPRADRLHTRIRWASCPFEAVAAELPTEGRVLELGCGHGLFALHLALTGPARQVFGSDIDVDKIGVARRAATVAAEAGATVTFDVAPAGRPPAGPWAGIAIVDVLYLLPVEQQRQVLADAAAELAPGGVLVVKEMADRPRWKARWNRWQEQLAVRVLRITEGATIVVRPPEELAAWLTEAGLEVTTSRAVDRHYLHPHHLLVARRPR